MRHSEGFKLVEASFPKYHAANNSGKTSNSRHQIGDVAGDICGVGGLPSGDDSGGMQSNRFICERSRRVSLAWSLRWQDDVLLKYDIEFSPNGAHLKGILLQ